MRSRLLARLTLAASLALWAQRGLGAPAPILLLARGDAGGSGLAQSMEADLAGRLALRREYVSAGILSDPIAKGQLLAALEDAPLVVAVGNEAIRFVVGELDDSPVYFIGSHVRGSAMSGKRASTLLTYSAADVLKALPAKWRQSLGLLYTPGYEPVVHSIREAASAAGVTLVERKVEGREMAPAARALLEKSKAVWVLGDPLLSEGAGFELLAEESLTKGVPLLGSDASEVGRGVLLCSKPAPKALALRASARILALVAAGGGRGVELAPAGGTILYHRRLAERFHLVPGVGWTGQ
jgi:hypothetical protein